MTDATTMTTTDDTIRQAVRETIENHRNLVVKDDAGYTAAQEALKAVKGRIKQVVEYFGPLVKKAHEMHKALKAKETEFTKPLDEIFVSISRECGRYKEEEDRKARQAAAIEESRLRKLAEDQVLAEAAAIEATGDTEQAERVLETPVVVAPPPVREMPKVQGIVEREFWLFKIENAALIPKEFTAPDLVKIGAYGRAMKGAAKIPGIRFYCEKRQY